MVHAYGLEYIDEDADYGDAGNGVDGVIFRCASSFEEFAYRFWIENRIWRHLNDPEAGPLPPRFARYVAHYGRSTARGDLSPR